MADIVTRRLNDLHEETAKRWGIPADVIAAATMGLGVKMILGLGYSEDQIVAMVRAFVADLT
jgi:hypothetical protein